MGCWRVLAAALLVSATACAKPYMPIPTPGTGTETEYVMIVIIRNGEPLYTAPPLAEYKQPISPTICRFAKSSVPWDQTNPRYLIFNSPYETRDYDDPAARYCSGYIPYPLPSGVNYRAYVQLFSTQCRDTNGAVVECAIGPRTEGVHWFISRPEQRLGATATAAGLAQPIIKVITVP